MGRGKRYTDIAKKVDQDQKYSIEDAFRLIKDFAGAKFDETVDVSVRLGVNPKHADQMVRGAVALPHGTGKTVRVVAFAKGEKEGEAQEAGADHVGGEKLVEKIAKENWLEFDRVIATPDMMGTVSKLGKLLGPRGLMPNPKVGTVTFDIGRAVKEAKAGKIDFRVEKAGIVHAGIGKMSFESDKLRENFMSLMDALWKAKPSSAKGTYFKGVTVSSTMGPGIHVDEIELLGAVQ